MNLTQRDLELVRGMIGQTIPVSRHVDRCWLLPDHWQCRERLLVQDLDALQLGADNETAQLRGALVEKDALIAQMSRRNDLLHFRLEKWRAAILKSAADAREAAEALNEH